MRSDYILGMPLNQIDTAENLLTVMLIFRAGARVRARARFSSTNN